MCNCIRQTEEKIQTREQAASVQWEHSGTMSSQLRLVPFRRDGKRSKVPQYISVKWRYCPLCGQKC